MSFLLFIQLEMYEKVPTLICVGVWWCNYISINSYVIIYLVRWITLVVLFGDSFLGKNRSIITAY